ncbi:MAG: hypothetical protein AAB966_05090 [Patescibacteria group bacterium]
MKYSLFLISILLTTSSFASDDVYNYVISRCHSNYAMLNQERFVSTVKETLKASFLDADTLATIVMNNGLSQQAQRFLSSQNYYSALEKCYGDDLLRKNLFTASLIGQDLVARGLGIATAGGILYFGGTLLAPIVKLYPMVGKALWISGFLGGGVVAIKILREQFRDANPSEKKHLEQFISENKQNMSALNQRAIAAVNLELEKVEFQLSESIFNFNPATSDLIQKRQKMIAVILLLQG